MSWWDLRWQAACLFTLCCVNVQLRASQAAAGVKGPASRSESRCTKTGGKLHVFALTGLQTHDGKYVGPCGVLFVSAVARCV